MTRRRSTLSVRRVLVAVDPQATGTEDLEIAARMARAFGAELRAIFVKTRDLLNMTELPIETVVIDRGGRTRKLEAKSLHRQLDVMAERVRSRLAREAGEDVKWSFEIVEGYVDDLLIGQASGSDLLTMCRGGHRFEAKVAAAGGRPLLITGHGPLANRPVVAIYEGDLRVTVAADRIARSLGVPMIVMLTGLEGDRSRLKKNIQAWASRQSVKLTLEESPREIEATAGRIAALQPGLVVLSPDSAESKRLDVALAGQPRLVIPASD